MSRVLSFRIRDLLNLRRTRIMPSIDKTRTVGTTTPTATLSWLLKVGVDFLWAEGGAVAGVEEVDDESNALTNWDTARVVNRVVNVVDGSASVGLRK